MARISTSNMDRIARELKYMGDVTGAMSREMLEAGADAAEEVWREVITERGHVDTGEMLESVGATAPFPLADGFAVDVYPQGYDRKGVRNAEKAFLLHYGWKAGRRKRGKKTGKGRKDTSAGDHFVDEVERRAAPKIDEAMGEIMEQYINK